MTNQNEWITVHHPVTGGTMSCTRKAFKSVWSSKGWVEGGSESPTPEYTTGSEFASPEVEDQIYNDPEED